MRIPARAILVLLAISLLAPLLSCAIEYRPGEREAEYLFNHGIGKPWIGGNPPQWPYWSWPAQSPAVRPYASYPIRGYPHVDYSFSFWSESDDDLLSPWPGSYPFRRYYDGGGHRGLFFYSEPSNERLQMHT